LAKEIIEEYELMKRRSRLMTIIGSALLAAALVMALVAMMSFPQEVRVDRVYSLDKGFIDTIQRFMGVPNSFKIVKEFNLSVSSSCDRSVELSLLYSGRGVEKFVIEPQGRVVLTINSSVAMAMVSPRPGCSIRVQGMANLAASTFQWLSVPAFMAMFVGTALLIRGSMLLLKLRAEGF